LKIDKEQLGPSSWSLTIEIPADEAQAEVETELKKLQHETEMPGFRKGKVPLAMLRKRFEQTLYLEVVRDNLGEYYGNALKEADIGDPVAPPEINIEQLEQGKPIIIKAKVETQPPVELASYDSLTVVKETVEITDREVDLQLERMREHNAVVSEDTNPAGPESMLEVDLQELDTGFVPLIGHKQENVTIDLAKASPEFRDSLLGVEAGQSRNVTIMKPPVSPDDDKLEEHFQVSVKSVKKKEIPQLDDDFAQQMGDDVADLNALKEMVKGELERQVAAIAYQRMSHLLAHQVVDNSRLEVPESMLKDYLDRIVNDARKSASDSEDGKFDEEFIRNQFTERATWNLKWYLIRQSLAEAEGLEITEDDLEKEYERIAEGTGKKVKQVKAAYSMDNRDNQLNDDMLERRILSMLVTKAKIVDKTVGFEEFFAKNETEHEH